MLGFGFSQKKKKDVPNLITKILITVILYKREKDLIKILLKWKMELLNLKC